MATERVSTIFLTLNSTVMIEQITSFFAKYPHFAKTPTSILTQFESVDEAFKEGFFLDYMGGEDIWYLQWCIWVDNQLLYVSGSHFPNDGRNEDDTLYLLNNALRHFHSGKLKFLFD